MKSIMHYPWLLLLACIIQACGGSNDEPIPDKPAIETTFETSTTELLFEAAGGTTTVEIHASDNVVLDNIYMAVSTAASDWCSATRTGKVITVTSDKNRDTSSRNGLVMLRYDKFSVNISVKQAAGIGDYTDNSLVFADDLCTTLQSNVTKEQIDGMKNDNFKTAALAMFEGNYATEFRLNKFRPYQNPSVMKAVNKEWFGYSVCDNPTGIYVNAGDHFIVVADDLKGQTVELTVQDLSGGWSTWTNGSAHQHFTLHKGINELTTNKTGLLYVRNFVNDDETMPLVLATDADKTAAANKTVSLHFVAGKVNGYFDATIHAAADWTRILSNAPFREIDAVGVYSQFTWTTDDLKNYGSDAVSILQTLDRIVQLEQEFDGRVKFGKTMRNRIHVIYDYVYSTGSGTYLYAYENRIAFNKAFAATFCKADVFSQNIWGPAHEVGHVNQVLPALKWAGMTEVTNNILSNYVQQQFDGTTRFNYDDARAGIIDEKQPHCMTGTEANASSEYLLKLVPFWQLHLYLDEALGMDFYKDLYEYYRTHNAVGTIEANSGALQLDFVRQTCHIARLNLVDFFTQWGFLRPVDKIVWDNQSTYPLTITQEEVDALVAEIEAAGYAVPDKDITTITDDNVDTF
ncbi:MAG: M60 family metallopeptidase [Mediterranea sp.]|jgi:hypothetical protein|nr:M60 family metallopeptidase [Mediterranea sp.]